MSSSDNFDYCRYCGTFLGEDYKEDHWCPMLLDAEDEYSSEEEEEELNFDEDNDDV